MATTATAMSAAPSGVDRMLRARRHYETLGNRLAPIERDQKRPPFTCTGWQRDPPTGPALDRYLRDDGCGLGCVHGLSGTATLDADADEEHVVVALEAVGVDFDALQAGPSTIGNPERPPKPWFRVPDGYDLQRRVLNWPAKGDPESREVVLELRAGAVQDVLPPTIHPDTGEPYRWTNPPRSREDLPLIPGPLLGLWLAWDQLRPMMEAACPWATDNSSCRPTSRRGPGGGSSHRSYTGPSIIEEWNRQIPPAVVLERNGYRPAGSGRWLAPDSTTGDPGVVELDGRIYSHHGSDLLAGPHSHDSFGVLTVLEHGGDPKEAARSAALELGMEKQPRRVSVAIAGAVS